MSTYTTKKGAIVNNHLALSELKFWAALGFSGPDIGAITEAK